MKHRQVSKTMGILCDPANPALAEFPTEFHSNWQWLWAVKVGTPCPVPDSHLACILPYCPKEPLNQRQEKLF